jgi:hypothetical protein
MARLSVSEVRNILRQLLILLRTLSPAEETRNDLIPQSIHHISSGGELLKLVRTAEGMIVFEGVEADERFGCKAFIGFIV